MNTTLKIILLCNTLIFSNYIVASDKYSEITSNYSKPCKQAQYGIIDKNNINFKNSGLNAYLFNCSILVVVATPNESRKSVVERNKNKQNIADLFLLKNIDIHYRDNDGGTLLMSIVVSDLATKWKLKTIQYLLSKGAHTGIKNNYGKTAMNLARYKNNKPIINLLTVAKR